MGMPKVVYDRKHCEGYFICVTMSPDDFTEDEDDGEDKAELLGANEVSDGLWEKEIDDDQLEDAVQAAKGCPADVIKVVDDEGNVIEGPEELPVEA